MNVATAYRCVNILADSVANLPMRYMRRKGDVFVEDHSSPLPYLLNVEPCPWLSAVDFWRYVVQSLILRGNAYIVPQYDYEGLWALIPVNPVTVTHDTNNDSYSVNDINTGVYGKYEEDQIIHLKNYSADGKTGISTLSYAATSLSIAATGDRETLNRFANGGDVRGIISNDTSVRGFGEYQDDQLAKTAMDVDARFRSGERIVSLPGQVQWNALSMSSSDMQFLESRKFATRDICRFFGVDPSFVYDDSATNYKSAELANVAFLSNTLNPLLKKIEVEFQRKLIAPSISRFRKFQFDRRELYACDLNSKVNYQTKTIAAGLYTVNDWRAEENKAPVEGGDTVLVSANLKCITDPSFTGQQPNKNGE